MFSVATERPELELMLVDPEYGEELFSLIDRNRTYLRTWLPWLDNNNSPQDSEDFLRHCLQGYFAKSSLTTLIRINGKIIGTVGFNSINHVNSEAEIGYWLDQNSTGNGYITSAVKKLIEIGFQQYSLNRLVIRVAVGNEPSRRVAQRLDFQFEGIAQQGAHHYGQFLDLEIYSLLKRDWQNR